MIMAKAKYKIGDKVKTKVELGVELFIVEVFETTCVAGVQTHYKGRLVVEGKMAGSHHIVMSETELE